MFGFAPTPRWAMTASNSSVVGVTRMPCESETCWYFTTWVAPLFSHTFVASVARS